MPATYHNLRYHIVFATKHRLPMITPDLKDRLYSYVGSIVNDDGGFMIDIGGMPDHVYPGRSQAFGLRVPSSQAGQGELVVMGQQAARANRQVRVAGRLLRVLRQRVPSRGRSPVHQNQEEHHRKVSYREELKWLLTNHGVEFDEADLDD